MKIDFSKYEIVGNRTLKSGLESNLFYDFKLLKRDENRKDRELILDYINKLKWDYQEDLTLVGIHTMGGYLVKLINRYSVIYYPRLRKVSNSLRREYEEKYILIDDVSTTFGTIKDAVKCIGYPPKFIIVIVNREDINGGMETIEIYPFGKIKIIELRKFLS